MANYILGQYNHKINAEEKWMSPLKTGVFSIVVQTPLDKEVFSNEMFIEGFEDPALFFSESLLLGETYYCHYKIKRLNSNQKFTIKLIETEKNSDNDIYIIKDSMPEQYIKTINVQQGLDSEWVDVEFTFTPQAQNFNTILLSLSRTADDFLDNTEKRIPVIAFLEVSIIKNILQSITNNQNNFNLLKMGIQSRPGLKMCINREEISIGRTGIYEIKNGEIKITFLSFITPATNKTNEELKNITSSKSFLNEVSENRPFDGFTIDYIYDNEQN